MVLTYARDFFNVNFLFIPTSTEWCLRVFHHKPDMIHISVYLVGSETVLWFYPLVAVTYIHFQYFPTKAEVKSVVAAVQSWDATVVHCWKRKKRSGNLVNLPRSGCLGVSHIFPSDPPGPPTKQPNCTPPFHSYHLQDTRDKLPHSKQLPLHNENPSHPATIEYMLTPSANGYFTYFSKKKVRKSKKKRQ